LDVEFSSGDGMGIPFFESRETGLGLDFRDDGSGFSRGFNYAIDPAGVLTLGRPGGGGCLIVPSGQIEASELGVIVEDMTVMRRILDEELEREFGKNYESLPAAGPFSFTSAPQMPQDIYLDGYGVLLLAWVKFPVADLPPTEEPPQEVEEPESRWEQTRREIYGVPLYGKIPIRPSSVSSVASASAGKYDRDEVEKLQGALLMLLKEASNIRGLRPDESVTVTVLGAPAREASLRSTSQMRIRSDGDRRIVWLSPGSSRRIGPSGTTVLTIRVKKADVDAFAGGDLTEEQFRGRAAVTAYSLPSSAAASAYGMGIGGPMGAAGSIALPRVLACGTRWGPSPNRVEGGRDNETSLRGGPVKAALRPRARSLRGRTA
jgi:hypothetical protein